MSALGKFSSIYLKKKIVKLFFYSLLIYFVIAYLLNNYSFLNIYSSLLIWGCMFTIIILYLYYKFNRIIIALDTLRKQEIYFEETNKSALKKDAFTRKYKKWLITNAIEENLDLNYRPHTLNTGGECCIYCCTTVIPLLLIASFSVIYLQSESGWITIIPVIIIIIILYPIIRRQSDIKTCKMLDSEIKRILYEEETGYSPLKDGKYTFKYRAWLIQKDKEPSRLSY